jgi:hypothetical protein
LFDAAEQAGCVAHLALVTHWQSGSAEGGDYDYYSSYPGRRIYGDWPGDDDEFDDEVDEEGGESRSLSGYEMGDIIDEGLTADHWSDRDGQKIALGEIALDQAEVVANQPLEDWTISREDFEGYTGNAGMTLERWYHRAAVIIWPRRNHFQVLCSAGTDASIAGLDALVKKWRRARKSEQELERARCLEFAAAIIDTWSARRFRYFWHEDRKSIDRSAFPRMLDALDRPELTCRFLAQVMPKDSSVQLDTSYPAFCRRHGWKVFEPGLIAVMDASSTETILRNAELLKILCLERKVDAERIGLCHRLAEHAVAALVKLDRRRAKSRRRNDALDDDFPDDELTADEWADDDWHMPSFDRPALLTALTKSLIAIGAEEPLARLIDHTLKPAAKYDLTDVHLKTIFALDDWLTRKLKEPSPAVSRWLEHCRNELQKRTAQAPAPPTDYRRSAKLSCSCRDCRELSRFLADPRESVLRLPLAKDRRQHLHQVIDGAGCDVTHVTTRKGRPFTLVCTKTTASYEKACKTYSRDCENLQRVQAIEEIIKRTQRTVVNS